MRLTRTHAAFWQQHQPQPAWIRRTTAPKPGIRYAPTIAPIHHCVNEHAGFSPYSTRHHAGNTFALIRMHCRTMRISVAAALAEYSRKGHDCPADQRRRARCARALRRLVCGVKPLPSITGDRRP